MDPEQVLDYTQYELHLKLKGFKWRETKEQNKLLYQAWHTALFVWQKKLPDLKEVLIKDTDMDEDRQQKNEDVEAKFKSLLTQWGWQT